MWLHASILKLYSIQCLYIWICVLLLQFAKARPLFNTEITPYEHCQLESAIVPSNNAATSYQLNPACQLVKGVEFGVSHTNMGYPYSKQHADLLKWSAAVNDQLNSKMSFMLEAFNQHRKTPFFQSVVHYCIIPDLLTFEASFGQRMEAFRQRWFGFGLSFTP